MFTSVTPSCMLIETETAVAVEIAPWRAYVANICCEPAPPGTGMAAALSTVRRIAVSTPASMRNGVTWDSKGGRRGFRTLSHPFAPFPHPCQRYLKPRHASQICLIECARPPLNRPDSAWLLGKQGVLKGALGAKGRGAVVLLRLARVYGDEEFARRAVAVFRLARSLLERAPGAVGHLLCALDLHFSPPREIALIGESDPLRRVALGGFEPNTVFAFARGADDPAARRVPLLEGKGLVEGRPAAYVCESFACRAPVTSPEELRAALTPRATPVIQ